MAKAIFTAIDPNGVTHKRTSDRRIYSHTVVFQESKAAHMATATSAEWAKQDGKNYDYDVECAAGTHPHVTHVSPASGYHSSYTPERIAEMQQAQRDSNVKRIASAKATIEGLTRAEYIAKKQAERVARVEAADYTVWHNAGWCGRLDLAHKLEAQMRGLRHTSTVMILEAVKA
jgi:hypothetical protein